MISKLEKNEVFFYLILLLICIIFFIGIIVIQTTFSMSIDSDSQGRVEELIEWESTNKVPAMSRGILHFYFLRMFKNINLPIISKYCIFDLICAIGFVWIFGCYLKRITSIWISLGSCFAFICHPFALKYASIPSGFFPFFLISFIGLIFIKISEEKERFPKKMFIIVGASILTLSVFLRFEGIFFLGSTALLHFKREKLKEIFLIMVGTIITVVIVNYATYFDLVTFVKGAIHSFQGNSTPLTVQPVQFLGYISYYFGIFPLVGALIGAFWGIKDEKTRNFGIIFILYTLFVFVLYLRGRFQFDQDRYYLMLLVVYLPFYGLLAKKLFLFSNVRMVAFAILACYCVCAFFFIVRSVEYFSVRQLQIGCSTEFREMGIYEQEKIRSYNFHFVYCFDSNLVSNRCSPISKKTG